MRLFRTFLIIFLSVFCLSSAWARKAPEVKFKVSREPVYQLQSNEGTIFIAGQPKVGDFDLLKEWGVKTIINLRAFEEMEYLEDQYAAKAKVKYYNVPVTLENLNRAKVDEVSAILKDKENYPVLLHCSTANRAAAVYVLDGVFRRGEKVGKALGEAEHYGLTKEALKEKVKEVAKSASGS